MNRPPGRVVVSSGLYEREMRPKADLRLSEPPRLLFVGYLRPEKGAEVLIEAFEKLRSRRPAKLTLAGGTDRSSQSETRIHEQIARSRYSADIERVGKVEFGEPLFNLYRQHDINVLPSLSEGTPRTLVEARAFGCAVVASRVGGVPTSIEDGQDGLLVPPGDPDALAATIDRLLSDDALRRHLVEEGIRRSKQMSVERYADQLVEELLLLPTPRTSGATK
jgi:glycosyltransferase involved in cell wall biosynthesis